MLIGKGERFLVLSAKLLKYYVSLSERNDVFYVCTLSFVSCVLDL